MTLRRFPIREVDRRVFETLRDGSKTVETRAGGPRYQNVQAGDDALFSCGEDLLTKHIAVVRHFDDIHSLLVHCGIKVVSPWLNTEEEQVTAYHSFPGYTERISQHGIIAMELETPHGI